MKIKDKKVLLCNCESTMPLDGKAITKAFDNSEIDIHSQLCTSQSGAFESALTQGDDIIVACGRQAPLFEEMRRQQAEDSSDDLPDVTYVDIRETAGWGAEGRKAMPKIAALLAQAALSPRPAETLSMESEGNLLILGDVDTATEAAKALVDRLAPVVVVEGPGDGLPLHTVDFPILQGPLKSLEGHFGAFKASFGYLATLRPSSRGTLQFDVPISNVEEDFDLVLDLRNGPSAFNQARDGYLKVAPNDKAGLFEAYFKLSDMVGEFAKPRYAQISEDACAHSRNKITGCTRCLDACGSSAIFSDGDAAAIDPFLCTGCGDCSAVCPTGAVSYALPHPDDLLRRLQVLSQTYFKAGGKRPALLVHDGEHGAEMLDVLGQSLTGLPAHVIPFAVNKMALFGHDMMMAAVATGFGSVYLLAPDSRYKDTDTIRNEAGLARTLLDGLKQADADIQILDSDDPTILELAFEKMPRPIEAKPQDIFAVGSKRQRTLLNFRQFGVPEAPLALEQGAPYGKIEVRTEGCTMCMSCVGACPTGALKDSKHEPVLSFVQNDCVQCGICSKTCPEKVISLTPQLDLSWEAEHPLILKKEDPHQCPSCGETFGVRSALDRMVEKLKDHPQFQDPARLERLMLCPDCRVAAEAGDNALMGFGERPKPRTTEDYLK